MPKTLEEKILASAHKEFVGQQLKAALAAINKDQTAISKQYHLGKSNRLNQWLSGLYYPDPYFLKEFCSDYGFTMDFFYRGIKAGVSSERVDDLRRVEEEAGAA